MRDRILADLDNARDTMNQAMHDIITEAHSAVDVATKSDGQFIMYGLMNFAELSDIDTLRRLFDTFAKKRVILDLLDRSINADGVQVFIGGESGYGIFDDCSVVTAPYHLNDDTVGVLGVIGPTRMAYDRVVPIVDVTARLLGKILNH